MSTQSLQRPRSVDSQNLARRTSIALVLTNKSRAGTELLVKNVDLYIDRGDLVARFDTEVVIDGG